MEYMAITNYKVNIVVDPIYRLEVRRSKCKATLVGFGGYYINPRTQYEDIQAIQRYSRDDIEKYLILHHSSCILATFLSPLYPFVISSSRPFVMAFW